MADIVGNRKRRGRHVYLSPCGTLAFQDCSNGRRITVDIEDRHWLDNFTWSIDRGGYAITSLGREDGPGSKQIFTKLHRVILNAAPGSIVDHANGDRLDCRRSNLRTATKSENAANSRIVKANAGFKGVTTAKRRLHMQNPFVARICVNMKEVYLGWFPSAEAAARAYDDAAIKYFGEFAVTNESLGKFQTRKPDLMLQAEE